MAVPSGIAAKIATIKTQVEAAHTKITNMAGEGSSGTVNLVSAIETIPTEDPTAISDITSALDTIIGTPDV